MVDSGRPSNRRASLGAMTRAIAAAVLALGFCWGCDGTGQSDCTASDYCDSGLVCRDGKCVERQCYSRKDCSTDEVCVSGLSVGQNPDLMYCSASCSDTNPCAGAGKVCVNGICQQGSVPDDVTQETIIIEDVGGDGFTPDGSTNDVARPDGTAPDGSVEDVVQDVPAELPPVEMGPDCKTCIVADDCGTGYTCQPVGAEKHCLRDCINDGDCMAGYTCYASSSQKSCLPVSYNCVACTFDTPCDNGKCCDFSSGACNDCRAQCYPCTYDYDCEFGLRCYRKTGNPTGVCVPECGERECEDKANYTCADNGKGVEICRPNTSICMACEESTPYLIDGICVECRNDGDCGALQTCRLSDHTCVTATQPCNDGLGSCKYYWSCHNECPASGTPEGDACIEVCDGELTTEGREDFDVFRDCVYTTCGGAATEDEWNECLNEQCDEAIIGCFWGCTYETCDQTFSCFEGCPDDNPDTTSTNEYSVCIGECQSDSSEQAQLDKSAMIDCALTECPICETYQTQEDEAKCNTCYSDAIMGACWIDYRKCMPSGTEYMTCNDYSICFTRCQYSANTQEEYDACRDACGDGADADAMHERIVAENCSKTACPICETAQTVEQDAQCTKCWNGTIYGDGTTAGICQAKWAGCMFGNEYINCKDMYTCMNGAVGYNEYVTCQFKATIDARRDYEAATACSLAACPICETASTADEEVQCDECFNGAATGACAAEWALCTP